MCLEKSQGCCPIISHQPSNAKSEGINNVIRTVLKRAYGYKNFDYFRMKILQKSGYLMDYLKWDF